MNININTNTTKPFAIIKTKPNTNSKTHKNTNNSGNTNTNSSNSTRHILRSIDINSNSNNTNSKNHTNSNTITTTNKSNSNNTKTTSPILYINKANDSTKNTSPMISIGSPISSNSPSKSPSRRKYHYYHDYHHNTSSYSAIGPNSPTTKSSNSNFINYMYSSPRPNNSNSNITPIIKSSSDDNNSPNESSTTTSPKRKRQVALYGERVAKKQIVGLDFDNDGNDENDGDDNNSKIRVDRKIIEINFNINSNGDTIDSGTNTNSNNNSDYISWLLASNSSSNSNGNSNSSSTNNKFKNVNVFSPSNSIFSVSKGTRVTACNCIRWAVRRWRKYTLQIMREKANEGSVNVIVNLMNFARMKMTVSKWIRVIIVKKYDNRVCHYADGHFVRNYLQMWMQHYRSTTPIATTTNATSASTTNELRYYLLKWTKRHQYHINTNNDIRRYHIRQWIKRYRYRNSNNTPNTSITTTITNMKLRVALTKFQKFKTCSNTMNRNTNTAVRAHLRRVLLVWYRYLLKKTNAYSNSTTDTYTNADVYVDAMIDFKIRRSLLVWKGRTLASKEKAIKLARKIAKKQLRKRKKTIEKYVEVMMTRDVMLQWKAIYRSNRHYNYHAKASALIRLKKTVVRNIITRNIDSIGIFSHNISIKRSAMNRLLAFNSTFDDNDGSCDDDDDDHGNWFNLGNSNSDTKPPIPGIAY